MKCSPLISDFQDKNDCWGLCVIKFKNNKFVYQKWYTWTLRFILWNRFEYHMKNSSSFTKINCYLPFHINWMEYGVYNVLWKSK